MFYASCFNVIPHSVDKSRLKTPVGRIGDSILGAQKGAKKGRLQFSALSVEGEDYVGLLCELQRIYSDLLF